MSLYTFRDYRESDIPFIHSSWGYSYYNSKNYHKFLRPDTFHEKHRAIRQKVLDDEGIQITVCCSSSNDDHILGWIAVDEPDDNSCLILHYTYVKDTFSGQGIGKDLCQKVLTKSPVYFTHMTPRWKKFLVKHGFEFYYLPHLI